MSVRMGRCLYQKQGGKLDSQRETKSDVLDAVVRAGPGSSGRLVPHVFQGHGCKSLVSH